ncbi:hypothetical protein [Sandaracinus amylolyticus]|uniref:hypothetical protein n=1 Tax=Sandaracinus amylolyticus TaxID=927083 RepID=UPI001F195956|nr:hypothetical protein [Sandaracinus amylolyticus]
MADALEIFRRTLRVPFREDARLIDDLALEARPVIEALEFAIGSAGADPRALEFREALALGALLGRRASLHRATPSVALVLVDALEAALVAIDRAPAPAVIASLRSVIVEGYCAAIEERVQDDAATRAADALAPARIAPRCFALVVAGEHDPDRLSPALDRAARVLLDADALACLVHVAITLEPTEDLAATVLGFDAAARLIGVACVFSGIDERWLAVARPRLDPAHLTIAPSLEEGLARALDAAGTELRESSALVRRFRRLLGTDTRRA